MLCGIYEYILYFMLIFYICIYNSCLFFLGVDVNEINNVGKFVFFIVLEDGKFDIVEYFIKYGGDVNIVDYLG